MVGRFLDIYIIIAAANFMRYNVCVVAPNLATERGCTAWN
jgi:hypothetical protein